MRGQNLRIAQTVEYHTETCYSCGAAFAMEKSFYENRLDDKKTWYCPNGHAQSYVGKSLREQLEEARVKLQNQMRETAAQQNRAVRAEQSLTRVRKRIKNGVCPCCKRTFKQLARHMETKHPGFKPSVGD